MSTITVYTTIPCGYCTRVKALLNARGLEYEEINLARDADGRMQLLERTGMMTFPQVFVGEELVGGFTETLLAEQTGRLKELLAA
ncbi:MAG TPA: glutaredoxin domain-containing protein [Solirubrobacteraceae bacterium]|nr:glutaredoxin domain-containing protein [Solirubrobacteraceae bacterium]